jgi:predicted Zn-dependent protease
MRLPPVPRISRHPAERFALFFCILGMFLTAPSLGIAQVPGPESDYNRRSGGPDLPSDFLLGLEAAQQISSYYGLVETDSLVRRINEIGYRVAYVTGRPDILFTFQILDMDVPNALALPGGWVFVTRGILDCDLTDAELAHLLGHEISHVTRSHFARQGRLDGLLSLLQTAVTVAVTMVGSTQSQSSGIVIEDPNAAYYPQTSADAALAGTALFGSLFHELLLRGFGRKLEMEADEGGRRLAALAGYPREAGESLLRKLHDRIFETREFGYWRTHPFFTDRVGVAHAAPRGADNGPTESEVNAYRLSAYRGLASAAASFRREQLADYLYELSLRASPTSEPAFAVHDELLRFRLNRMERKNPLLRTYGPLLADYDSLIAGTRRSAPVPEEIGRVEETRDSIAAKRLRLLPQYLQSLDSPSASTQILDLFVRNFPEHPLANQMRLRLARAYRLSGRPDLAAMQLSEMIADGTSEGAGSDSSDAGRARSELLRTISSVGDPDVCQHILDDHDDPPLRDAATAQLKVIADSLKVLEVAGRFTQTFPNSPAAEDYRIRLSALADAEYKKGRLHEALGDEQEALAIYNRVSILAPGTAPAEVSRQGINRIQALASTEPDR